MLSEDIKTEIQSAYSRLLSSKGFKSRYCQKVMIAEIARNLSQNFVEKGAAEKTPVEKSKTLSAASPADPFAEDPLADSLLDQGNVCVIEAGYGDGQDDCLCAGSHASCPGQGEETGHRNGNRRPPGTDCVSRPARHPKACGHGLFLYPCQGQTAIFVPVPAGVGIAGFGIHEL